jgi:hypothetical protein
MGGSGRIAALEGAVVVACRLLDWLENSIGFASDGSGAFSSELPSTKRFSQPPLCCLLCCTEVFAPSVVCVGDPVTAEAATALLARDAAACRLLGSAYRMVCVWLMATLAPSSVSEKASDGIRQVIIDFSFLQPFWVTRW